MVYTFISVTYLHVEVNLIYKMYKQHRYEFHIHIKRMSLLFFFSILSNIILLLSFVSYIYYGMCEIIFKDKDEAAAWYDLKDQKGICEYVVINV